MRPVDDEALMGVLRDALVPADLTPSAEEMDRFSRALETGRGRGRYVAIGTRHVNWRAHTAPRILVAAGLALLAGLGALSGGVATDSLPGPLRSAAFDLGLPVSSPSLVAAEAASARLAGALAARDRAAVLASVPVLEQRLAVLGAADRAHVEPGATTLLSQATEFLATTAPLRTPANPGDDGSESTGSSTSTPETTEPSDQAGTSSSESSSSTSAPESSAPRDGSSPQSNDGSTSTTSMPEGDSTIGGSAGGRPSSGDSSSTDN